MLFKEILETEYVPKEFSLEIGNINVTKERNIYTVLRRKYYALAVESLNTFSNAYDTYNDCTDILEKTPKDFQVSIANVIDEIKKDLISIGKYDWDYETIYEYANQKGYFDSFYNPFDKISDKILSIYQDVEMQKQYREDRKNNRSRWVGGTFGGNAINAYSHQIDLAARNMAEGVAHSLFNMAGNAISKASANSDLKALFKNKKLKTSLMDGLFKTAFELHYIYVDLFSEAIDWDIPDNDDCQKSQRLLNNIKSGAISKDKANEVCQEIIDLNPYDLDIYEYLFSVYGDKNGKLQVLADYFGVNITDTKDDIALKYAQENQGETEEDAKEAMDKLVSYCKEINLPVSDDLKCIQYINDLLNEFDLKYRTVDDVVCETREGADLAREELESIKAFVNEIPTPTKDSLLDYEEYLLNKIDELKNTFNSELKDKYLGQLDQYMSDFNKYFCSTRLFGSVDRKQAGKDRALEYVKTLNFSTLEELEADYIKFEAFLPKVGLTKDEAIEAVKYLEKQRERIASGKKRSKDTGIVKGELKMPFILLIVVIVLRVIRMFSASSLISILSLVALIAMIISIIMLIKKSIQFKKTKNSQDDISNNETEINEKEKL